MGNQKTETATAHGGPTEKSVAGISHRMGGAGHGHVSSPKSIHSAAHYKLGEREAANTDKAILNLMKEHNKLKASSNEDWKWFHSLTTLSI